VRAAAGSAAAEEASADSSRTAVLLQQCISEGNNTIVRKDRHLYQNHLMPHPQAVAVRQQPQL
jgi:hypothetical protein